MLKFKIVSFMYYYMISLLYWSQICSKPKLQVLCTVYYIDELTFQESYEDRFDSLETFNKMLVANIVRSLVYDVQLWLKHSLYSFQLAWHLQIIYIRVNLYII